MTTSTEDSVDQDVVQQQAEAGEERRREDIEEQYRWDLSQIYPGWEPWQQDMTRLQELMDRFAAMRGTLEEGADRLLEAFGLQDELGKLSYRLYRYPQLQYDLDQRDNEVQARMQEVQAMFAEFGAATAWFEPELLALGRDTVTGWIDEQPGLEPYRFPLMETFRAQEHVLDERGEQLLAFSSRFNSSPPSIYNALSNADVEFPTVELHDGRTVRVTHGEYRRRVQLERHQGDRATLAEGHYSWFASRSNTYAALYNATCQRDWARARARNFSSTAEAALHSDNVPVAVLETLIQTARDNSRPLQRYHALRKRALGLEHYYPHDTAVLIQPPSGGSSYPYDEARRLAIEAVAPLGEAYQRRLERAVSGRWIDVFETRGKRSGAYSAGVYGVHPYILLNYTETLDDVFTLTHELGHTLHSVLSNEHQPFATSSYTIFVAEVASTLNEALLLDSMLQRAEQGWERIALLQHAIRNVTSVFFAQVLFADYELQAHRMAERGEPITADTLSQLYVDTLDAYYGDAVEPKDYQRFTWARIPHFYNAPYYVYKYATSFAASSQIARRILSGDEQAVADYLTLLGSGGNDHPMEQLRRAGVDLAQPDPVQAVVDQLDELVDQLDEALAAVEH